MLDLRKTTNSFLAWFIINLILLLALIPIIILAFSKFPVSEANFIHQPKKQLIGLEVDISNWQTYQNEKYGFEIKYPQNWESMASENRTWLACFKELDKEYYLQGSEVEVECLLYISIRDNNERLSAKELASKRNKYGGTVTNVKAVGINSVQLEDYLGRETYITYNDKVLIFSSLNLGTKELNELIYNVHDQILSTFKFLE